MERGVIKSVNYLAAVDSFRTYLVKKPLHLGNSGQLYNDINSDL